jgi:pSer/pThr/pTyr-binding forkhead associated (FHA) protein
VCINSPKVSRRHARVTVSGRSAILQDLDSKNGVFVHGKRVVGPCALQSGDEILIGPIALRFRVIAPPPSTETVAEPFLSD